MPDSRQCGFIAVLVLIAAATPPWAMAQVNCVDTRGYKFAETDLADGVNPLGEAVGEVWTVECPEGATPCPVPVGSLYTPIHSGEHLVEYMQFAAGGEVGGCTYSLHVGPPGLQVELEWEWDDTLGPSTVDLDVHLHKPADLSPWGGDGGTPVDCAWDNCRASDYDPISPNPNAPDWFEGAAPPDPVDWYLSPILEENTCYFLPQDGQLWQQIGMGCHNPRLSLDNVVCDPFETNPNDSAYCHPETVNIDYMPIGEWTRIGVHYYSNQGQTYDVHPKVKIFCEARLVLELGDATATAPGYSEEVVFTPADGGTMFWLVADVRFVEDPDPGESPCVVSPLYATPARTPYYSTVAEVQGSIGPPYPSTAEPIFADGFESGDVSSWSTTFP